jgi:hypothetical protein
LSFIIVSLPFAKQFWLIFLHNFLLSRFFLGSDRTIKSALNQLFTRAFLLLELNLLSHLVAGSCILVFVDFCSRIFNTLDLFLSFL